MGIFGKLRAARSHLIESLSEKKQNIKGVWLHQYKVDLGIDARWSLTKKIKYNRLGFTNEDYFNFDLAHHDYRDYISYRERLRLEYINGRFANFLGEKLLFERLFGSYIQVPHIHCWVKDKRLLELETELEADLLQILKQQQLLIAKPTRSIGGGNGIHRLAAEADDGWSIDGKPVSDQQLLAAVSSWEEYIIVDYVRQAEYAQRIYPETTNSIRVITARRKSGDYEILQAFHRFGSDLSRPVDNISSGGLVSLVDIETGVLGPAKRKTQLELLQEVHPDSGARIEGVVIPNWEEIKKRLLHVHRLFPYYTFFAWDVVVQQDQSPCILEINRGSDLGIQMIQPMRSEKIGAFMREYGLLDKR